MAVERRGAPRRAWRARAGLALVGVGLVAATVAAPLASATGVGAPLEAAGGKSGTRQNPFGITLVRFKPGTGSAAMDAAVAQAGGVVVTDLKKVNTVAVAPRAADFRARIAANPAVSAAWVDRVVSLSQPDVASDAGGTAGSNAPALGSPGVTAPPDPWHNAPSFLGESNPEGILQWDDNRMAVPAAWRTTTGNRSVRVAVLDTGVQGSHKELLPNYNNRTSANTIPCNTLVREYGAAVVNAYGLRDCSSEDGVGHGTWVASRIAGAANGFASNGVAPNVEVVGYKVLAADFGGLTSWIVAGMLDACSRDVDLINMSLGGYDDPVADADDYLLWVDAASYCRARGTAIFASAGNEHVRVNRVNLVAGGRALSGVGQVDTGSQGYMSVIPGGALADADLRGLLEVPAGVPGVVMVSSTGNALGTAAAYAASSIPAGLRPPAAVQGRTDQLAYYSNYGARIDLAAPGGARKFGIPRYDGGPGDILYGGWGSLGALDPSGEICTTASGSLATFACFKVNGAGFGWLQGTSMSAPNATGVAALALAARPGLQGNPDALLARLQSTARLAGLANVVGPNNPTDTQPSYFGVPCPTGYCHIDWGNPIANRDAYGAGIVNAAAAVAP